MTNTDSQPSVVLVDALPVTRQALRLFAEEGDLSVVAEAASSDEALDAIEGLSRANLVVLVAVSLPGERDAFWLMREIRARHPQVRILAHGGNTDPMIVSWALFNGADGYLDHAAEVDEFVGGVIDVTSGQAVLVGVASNSLGRVLKGIDGHRSNGNLLSSREVQVLTAAAEGLTAKQIGLRLDLRERTITTHLTRIYSKLGAHGRSAAVAKASRAGIIRLPDTPAPELAHSVAN